VDVKGPQDTVPFHPYYTVKDLFAIVVFTILFAGLVFYAPNLLGEAVNYVPANPLSTPDPIVPEWYFLPFYAILRAVPDKLGGVLCMGAAILSLFVLPWLDTSSVRSGRYRPIFKQFFVLFVIDCILLGVVGGHHPEGIWVPLGRIATVYYFIHLWIILPVLGLVEKPLPLPESISKSVLGGASAQGAHAAPEKR
jgi:ubiquinol-cytochrome c reductase cytochrome b subunit